ncbi:MAG: outer membrane beta-barrel protein [Flavisolibacter sp.]
MQRFLCGFLLLFSTMGLAAQQNNSGLVVGTVMDEKNRALEGASIEMISFSDSNSKRSTLTDKNGAFQIAGISFGYYRLQISFSGLQQIVFDSIHLRAERFDFNMGDIVLKPGASGQMTEIIIFAEKPLIQSKDGNITFNAGESPLSAGGNASELLTNVPLVTKDPDGKLLVRGKEPKILIDDKPVQLNLQQLQDLLEAMPGSSIEKIEVMTNPPPQYANEQGGVINIVTKKGSIGVNGRISVYAGTRGDAGANGSFNYRKQGLSLNINAGAGYNYFEGEGYSKRQNIYPDSINYFNTINQSQNRSIRPNFRANLNYDLNKYHSLNFVLQYNENDFNNQSITAYTNLNRLSEIYRLSERNLKSTGYSRSPNFVFSYTMKTKKPGESLKLISDLNVSSNSNTRDFHQQYFDRDYTPNGDSLQQQINQNNSGGYQLRLNYDLPVNHQKTFFSVGSFYTLSRSNVDVDASYRRKSDSSWAELPVLTNHFLFRQQVNNFRASVKQILQKNFSATMGVNAEQTMIRFDLYKLNTDTANTYWSFLPFATINKNWQDKLNLNFSYRRTIRRPGINELNPTIDFSDPYNIRFGNPGLIASLADNFDLVLGKTKTGFYTNIGFGYNIVKDIFSQVRTLLPDGKTQTTWQNISGRKEYEISTWNGYTLSKKIRVNLSGSYTYNTYSEFDKKVRKYRNGASFTSNLNTNYLLKDLYNFTTSFTFNRFANPQGTVRSNVSMNIGLQAKMLRKRLTATVNIIDPFVQQQSRVFTYGTNFMLESFNSTQTRNFRLSLGYNLTRPVKKKTPVSTKQALNNLIKTKN